MREETEKARSRVEPVEEEFERKRGVTAVAVEGGLVHIAVTIAPDLRQRQRVFQTLAEAGISVYLIKFHDDGIHFVVREEVLERARQVLDKLGLPFTLTDHCATVTVLSSAMRDLPGVMATIAEAVYDEGVDLLETGDSHDAVILLVKSSEAAPVAEALKKKFGL